jgi:hypothetical protein
MGTVRGVAPEMRVCGEPAWEDPGSGRVAWFLQWVDRWGRTRRMLYGYGPGARRVAQAVADCIAELAQPSEVKPCAVVISPHEEGAPEEGTQAPGGPSW